MNLVPNKRFGYKQRFGDDNFINTPKIIYIENCTYVQLVEDKRRIGLSNVKGVIDFID